MVLEVPCKKKNPLGFWLVLSKNQFPSVESRGPTFGRQSLHSWLSFGELSASVRPKMRDVLLTLSNRTFLSQYRAFLFGSGDN